MTDRPLVDRLLDEVQEEYDVDGVLPLYMFAWSLAGLGMDRSHPEFISTCRKAYDAFIEQHPDLQLVWVPWPIDVGSARMADDGTPINLDGDPDAPAHTPLLALVAPDGLPPAPGTRPRPTSSGRDETSSLTTAAAYAVEHDRT
jgi:hypothetical protein